MKRQTILLMLVSIFVLVNSNFAQQKAVHLAPKIIETIPAYADCAVDPNLEEIVLLFDQDMAGGMSVLDTKNQPEVTGRPQWINPRKLSIPVKLYSGKLYHLVFNSTKHQNFRSVSGIPMQPEELSFMTRAVSAKEANKKAYQELREVFPLKYSYATFKDINWEEELEMLKPALEKAETKEEFALKLLALLKKVDDPHMWVEIEGQRFNAGNTKIVDINYGAKQPMSVLENKFVGKGYSVIGGSVENVGYLSVRNWSKDMFNIQYKQWGNSSNKINGEELLAMLFKYPNLIIDVRENGGGNETFAKKLAAYFITDSLAYEKVRFLNEESGKFDYEKEKWFYPNIDKTAYSGKVYVLTGPSVMSSNEAFVLMMKQAPNSTVIGMKTYGSTANPKPHKLSNGVTLFLPSWQAYTLDGTLIEGNGIAPDVEIKTSFNDFKNKEEDVLFQQVLEMIENKK